MKEKQKKRKILIGKIPLFVAKLTGFGHTDVVEGVSKGTL